MGHYIFERKAGYSREQIAADKPSKNLQRLFGRGLAYFRNSRNEIHAEVISFHQTGTPMSRGEMRICKALLVCRL